MEEKLFSIITPTLNCGRKIEATIRSVLSQDKKLFEYIIIDGGSTDDTLQTIAPYVGQLHLMTEKDGGLYDAMNKGIGLARGKYLYFLGAGDCVRESILDKIKTLMPIESPAFVYGDVYFVVDQNRFGGEFNKTRLRKNNICHQAIFYERTIFEIVGTYEQKYCVMADYVFNFKCFAAPPVRFKHLDFIIADFEGNGLSVNQLDHQFEKDRAVLIKRYLGTKHYVLYHVSRFNVLAIRLIERFRPRLGLMPQILRRYFI